MISGAHLANLNERVHLYPRYFASRRPAWRQQEPMSPLVERLWRAGLFHAARLARSIEFGEADEFAKGDTAAANT